ncbi:hypothetical protein C5D36_15800 [Rathayibacter sp. AY1C6]|uniref:GrpB family protein n=1 Tax=Rathayibacter sp. AY1C6 TaxID=2080539 RepID=UPI000CE794BE|nr:GrpB family protein [Rathayibacter sp. AY1C6]PPG12101.1 hypothetical protein C5D36_15800 [Rathayibacter sp. AY1C6]
MTPHRSPSRPDVVSVELVGGPEPLELALHEHDPEWSALFEEHRRRILEAVPGVRVEHIGSTSVPGLPAKPIVDVLVVVPDVTAEEDHVAPLLEAGYVLRTREPGHRLVRTPGRDAHVHIYEEGHPAIDAYLLLRDRLRTDPADRELYRSTKASLLLRRWEDGNDYADAKSAVIAAILERARSSQP